jgi:hypothetical protein
MHWGRRILLFIAVLVVVGGIAPTARALPKGPEVVAACRDTIGAAPEVGPRACRTGDQFLRGFANGCRNLDLKTPCATLDGRGTGVGHMATYAASWTHRALALQRGLDDDVALARSLLPHTHNSFNSSVYLPTVTNQDPNQIYSMRDQLNMDVRAIEMDIHWVPSAHGKATTLKRAVVLCHGSEIIRVHVGCSTDRWFPDGLTELRQWLRQPENANEVVLLYLENALDTRQGHDTAAKEIKDGLGDLVARPPANQRCAPLPTSTSPAQLRAQGHRVIIVGNCGPGAWGTWVHERGPRANWFESGSGAGDDYPGITKGCAAERARAGGGHAIVRWFEDSTWVSAMADGRQGALTTREAATMARCGATLIGFDQLTPEDPRLAAIVWSWAPGQPTASAGPQCAASTSDSRFYGVDCGQIHEFACTTGPDAWRVTSTAGPFAAGAAACAKEFPGSVFAVPANGWENSLMRTAAGFRAVWLNYNKDASGVWHHAR